MAKHARSISTFCALTRIAFSTIAILTFHATVHAQDAVTHETAQNPAFFRAETVNLTGDWRFGIGDDPSGANEANVIRHGELNRTIKVPFAPQSEASGIGEADLDADVVWYERTIELPSDWDGAVLSFEAIDYQSEIYVNGVLAKTHTGGFDPISIDVSNFLSGGKIDGDKVRHTITVRASDSRTARDQIVGKQERKSNEGVIFYGNMIGIWKDVRIEKVADTHLTSLQMHGTAEGELIVKAEISGSSARYARVTLRAEGQTDALWSQVVPLEADGTIEFTDRVNGVELWSPETPNIYLADVELLNSSMKSIDHVKSYTGFKTFEMKNGYYYLNGEPYQLRGLLNQAIYPDTLYTPTDEEMITDFEMTKQAGFNGERRHQTTPRARDMWLAAKMGLWMAIELPSARDLTNSAASDEAERQWRSIVKSYAWNPVAFFLVPGNESWGWLKDDPNHLVANSTPEGLEAFQWQMYHASVETAPPGTPISPGDGWQQVTYIKNGVPVPGVDPSTIMLNVHHYHYGEDLLGTYRNLEGNEIPRNGMEALLDLGYQWDGKTPVILSEMGGRAVDVSGDPTVFAYGKIFRDTGAWSRAMGNTIIAAGILPIFRGGFVLTQTRDAGNNPSDPKSGGERNGVITADGRLKVDNAVWADANRISFENWKKNLEKYLNRQNATLATTTTNARPAMNTLQGQGSGAGLCGKVLSKTN